LNKAVKGAGFWGLFGIDVASRDAELSNGLTPRTCPVRPPRS
jgi:hypothetical protein